MIREADRATPHNPFDVASLDAGHCAFASRPREVATILAGLP